MPGTRTERTLPAKVAASVEAATVRLPELGGRGVLVADGLVLTAMHCVGWDGSAGLVMGDHHPVPVETQNGARFRLCPWYADVVSDMAALGTLDDQEFPDDEEAFDEWREQTIPVPLSTWIPKIRNPRQALRTLRVPWDSRDVWLRSLDGRWTHGRVTKYGFHVSACVALDADEALEGGMSGGPVVDVHGHLVGTVSWGSKEGTIPLARLALPEWILRRLSPSVATARKVATMKGRM